MRWNYRWLIAAVLVSVLCTPQIGSAADEVVRPEEIKSMRQVIYDTPTYVRLAKLWKEYYDEFPSEYAYANWMYAARYAGESDYTKLLTEGLKDYQANPTLLYLKALLRHGARGNDEGRRYLERAIALDPGYTDPWFGLTIHYMESREEERFDLALRHLLENGAISDEVMDYNHNVLIGLEQNAILITNGDNDTYPAWILTRILNVRPDVTIVNRSLLNSEWYPGYMIEKGLPRFVNPVGLTELRKGVIKANPSLAKPPPTPGGPFGDTLIHLLIGAAERAGRPVYIAGTVYETESLKATLGSGRHLGLATLVTVSKRAYADQLMLVYRLWIDDFRTGGIESWRLRHSDATDAGRRLLPNYARAITCDLAELSRHETTIRRELFDWYTQYIEELLSEDIRFEVATCWCSEASDIDAVDDWGRTQGLKCNEEKLESQH